jgi:Protein of unknown function (DUF2795)
VAPIAEVSTPGRVAGEPEGGIGRAPGSARDGVRAGALLSWLSSEAFPADRELLVASARTGGAPAWLTESLGRLPEGRVFQGAEQLAAALRAQPRVRILGRRGRALFDPRRRRHNLRRAS